MPLDQVRIAFDGDTVLFDDSSELVCKQHGQGSSDALGNQRRDGE